jgi:hypothetical protein
VLINMVPSGEIQLKGGEVKSSPWRGEAPVGRQTFTLRSHDGREKTLTVEVKADGSTSRCWDFELGAACGAEP